MPASGPAPWHSFSARTAVDCATWWDRKQCIEMNFDSASQTRTRDPEGVLSVTTDGRRPSGQHYRRKVCRTHHARASQPLHLASRLESTSWPLMWLKHRPWMRGYTRRSTRARAAAACPRFKLYTCITCSPAVWAAGDGGVHEGRQGLSNATTRHPDGCTTYAVITKTPANNGGANDASEHSLAHCSVSHVHVFNWSLEKSPTHKPTCFA
jgi:hypothetical protein